MTDERDIPLTEKLKLAFYGVLAGVGVTSGALYLKKKSEEYEDKKTEMIAEKIAEKLEGSINKYKEGVKSES